MAKTTIPMDSFIRAYQVFHWATKRHYQLWFTGNESKRHRRSEAVLKRLVRKGKLRSMQYGSKLIYATPRKGNVNEFSGLAKVVHGLACTECLVRFWRSYMDGVVVPERHFFGLGCVPEWGIIYPTGTMLLFEFCTKSNFYYASKMRGKLNAYRKYMRNIEQKFNAKPIVVFVIDIDRESLKRWISGVEGRRAGSVAGAPPEGDGFPLYPFFFVDYKTVLQVPFGQQLISPIYLWRDGKSYPLVKNV